MAKRVYGLSWTLWVGAVAALAMEPALAETGAPASANEPEATPSAATLLVESEAAISPASEAELAQTQPIAITDIQLEATETGFTLQLETTGELSTPATSTTGNATVADIPNAVLQLEGETEFFVSDPADGIALVRVSALPGDQVRIAITGADAPPAINLSTLATGLVVTATPGDPLAVTPDEDSLQVVGTGEEDGYFVPNASTATRTDTPLRDIPNSIQVIPRQIIEDQQATSLEEVLGNAAGVNFAGNDEGRGTFFVIRGFNTGAVLRDGFILNGNFTDTAGPEVANLERVEVLRGPASVLYGQVEPGGVINLVTKQPLSEPYYNVQFQVGNRGFISPSIDISGPLTEDGRVLYRLNALYRREESFRDLNNDFERFFIAPTVSWQISDRTDLTFNLEYMEDHEAFDSGTVAFGDGIADVPLERVFSDPDSSLEQSFLRAGYTLEHRFSDNWKLRNQFLYTTSSLELGPLQIPFFLNETTGNAFRPLLAQDYETDTYSFNTNVQGEFNTGSVEHTLLFGVDLSRTESNILGRLLFDPTLPPINIFDPDTLDFDLPATESLPITSDEVRTDDQLGIYLQDQIDILDNLILVAGLRYDTFVREGEEVINNTETSQSKDALTPRIGLVYQPIEPISLYANYSRSFTPNFGTDINGDFLPPEEGVGLEIGVRGEIIENRLAATLAYFDITKQNVATPDPSDPTGQASIATGEQRSRGVDFNLTGEILPGWNIVASYAYIDAEITEDNTLTIGNRLINVPEHNASLWTSYEIQSGDLQGLGFGLGLNFIGERQGDLENSFNADSYFLTNAVVFYRQDNWQLRLNVDNLFDVDYIESLGGAGRTRQITPGDPTTIRASFSYTF